jgi:hypothetical protein
LESTTSDRRRAIQAKITALGGLNPQYYIDVAAALGYTITIDEFTPFWCGLGVAGEPCGDQDTIFYWRVNMLFGEASVQYFLSCSGKSGDPLSYLLVGSDLICVLEKYKPAHTVVIVRLVGPGFDEGFDNGFNSIPSINLEGGFTIGFSGGFDVYYGGGFSKDGFDDGFDHPH